MMKKKIFIIFGLTIRGLCGRIDCGETLSRGIRMLITGKQLLEFLQKQSEEVLAENISLYNGESDEYYSATKVYLTNENHDVLDDNNIVITFN